MGTGLVLVLLVAGFFLLADLLLLVVLLFAAQSNLAFLGMWIELTPIELAAFLFSILDSECLPGTAKVFFGLILLFFLFSDGYVFDWKVDRV